MNKPKDAEKHVFNPGKARWLREKGGTQLTSDQLALLLAMAKLESELGRELSSDETEAIEVLGSKLEGFDPQAITDAVRYIVEAPADPDRKTSWPELKRHKT